MSRSSPIDGPGACGISYPFKVTAFAGGSVGLTSKVTLACPIIPDIDAWLNEVVQPAASLYFGTSVADVKAGSYSCRPRNNQAGAKVSEHAFGNALDIMGFRFADGRDLSVVRGWSGAPVEQEFLREVFVGACRYFTTVLGPGADPFHFNHFHLDLARHDPRGRRHVCKPILKFTPRLNDIGTMRPQSPRPDPERQPYQQPEIDIDDDNDPFEVSGGPLRAAPAKAPARPAQQEWASVERSSPRPRTEPGSDPFAVSPRSPATGLGPSPSSLQALPPSRPPAGWAAPPTRASAAYNQPSPPATIVRPPRGYEPVPDYQPPPAPPSRPVVLQPQLWSGQPIY
jgi:hypothetical protein